MYNYMSREVTTSIGYDYILRQVSSAFAVVLISMKFDYLLGFFIALEVCLCASWHLPA